VDGANADRGAAQEIDRKIGKSRRWREALRGAWQGLKKAGFGRQDAGIA